MKTVIIYILLLMALQANLFSAGFKNSGAKISLNNTVYVKVKDMEVKNDNNGEIIVRQTSELKVEGADLVNESGSIKVLGSVLGVNKNLINKDIFNTESSSLSVVIMNIVNSGTIYNESVIEIGE
ncbi:MAG: hypothetical protein RO257_13900 [Candidatus Kapabacteria bacterium]|jgi:hypothetical protein|nr:hypothetical protein [Candidatus Kapabacteria bacterium]